jgi:hypothetical protein
LKNLTAKTPRAPRGEERGGREKRERGGREKREGREIKVEIKNLSNLKQ